MNPARGLTLCLTILAIVTGPLQAQPSADDAPFWKAFEAKADIAAAFASLPKPTERFSAIASELSLRKDGPALAKIVGAMEKIDPNHRLLGRVRMHAALLTSGDPTATYRAAYKSAPDAAARQAIREDYLRGMARQGRAVEAYRAFPGGSESFRVLADQLFVSGLTDKIAGLMEEHSEHFPDDHALDIHRGQQAFDRKDYAAAHRLWTAAFADADEAAAARYQGRRARAAVAAGKWQEGYAQLGSGAFDAIGRLCLELNRTGDLEDLLGRHGSENSYHASTLTMQLALQKNPKADLTALIGLDKGTAVEKKARLRNAVRFLAEQGRALEVYREAPDTFWELATHLWHHDNLRDLRRLITLHKENSPDDPQAAEYEAFILLDQGETAKAFAILNAVQKALAPKAGVRFGRAIVVPSDIAAVYYPGKLAAGSTVAEIIQEDRNVATLMLANYFLAKRDPDGLQQVIDAQPAAMGALARASRNWDYTIDLKIMTGKIDDAIDHFIKIQEARKVAVNPFAKPANPAVNPAVNPKPNPFKKQPADPPALKVDTDSLKYAEFDLIQKLAAVGEGMRAYRISKFPEAAFSRLALHLVREGDIPGVRTLLAEHRKKSPADPHLALVEGELALLEGRLFEAEEGFRRAAANKRTDPLNFGWSSSRHKLLSLDIRRGRVLECYRAEGGDSQAFRIVANQCVSDKASAALDALLDVHRESFPRDPFLNAMAAKADMLRADWDAALKRMNPAEARYEPDREDVIICLVHLKRTGDAVKIALDWEANSRLGYAALPAILAHAAADNAKETERLLGLYAYRGPGVAYYYSHPVLGPLLRGEAMASVRERFPEPKK